MLGDGEVPNLMLDVIAALGRLAGLSFLPTPPRRVRAQEVDRPTVGLGQQERPERSSVGVELLRLVPQAQEDLLEDLLRQGAVVDHPAGQSEDGAAMAAVRLGQGVFTPTADGDNQGAITGVVQGGGHRCLLFGATSVGGWPGRANSAVHAAVSTR